MVEQQLVRLVDLGSHGATLYAQWDENTTGIPEEERLPVIP